MLLDEPTASLDLAHELLVLRLARRASKSHIGVLMILHDLNLAARFSDYVALMVRGMLVATGPPRTILTDATLSQVYGTNIRVENSERFGRLVVHTE